MLNNLKKNQRCGWCGHKRKHHLHSQGAGYGCDRFNGFPWDELCICPGFEPLK